MEKFDGVRVKWGDTERVFAPLNFKALKKIGPRLGVLSGMANSESLSEEARAFMVEIALYSLRRNYPDITEDEAEEHLDTGNIKTIVMVILTGSGLQARATTPGEAPGP